MTLANADHYSGTCTTRSEVRIDWWLSRSRGWSIASLRRRDRGGIMHGSGSVQGSRPFIDRHRLLAAGRQASAAAIVDNSRSRGRRRSFRFSRIGARWSPRLSQLTSPPHQVFSNSDRFDRSESFHFLKIYIWEIRGSQNLKNPATRKKWPRHRIPEWWSSKRATAPALYHIVPSLRIVPHECQHARDPTDGGIATLNTPGPVSFSVKPISDACAPQ